MINDIKTIMWKEIRDSLGDLQRKSRNYKIIGVLIFFGTAAGLSLVFQERWINSNASLVYWMMFPLVFTSQMVADSFAGERERHTLETLLASRMPDEAIYIRKLLTPVFILCGAVLLWMTFTMIPMNIVYRDDGLQLFPITVFVLGPASSIAICLLVSAMGTFASLHAPSVQSAQVRIGFMTTAIFFLPIVLFGVFLILPQTQQQQIIDLAKSLGIEGGIIIATMLCFVIGTGLAYLGTRVFRRSRLILD